MKKQMAAVSGLLSLAAAFPVHAEPAALTMHAIVHNIGHNVMTLSHEVGFAGLAAGIALLVGVVAYRIRRAR